ncbi:MAG TPA: single-stranded-DNA-specific exonuclease RecJ [Alphaproteobacteria bacterium]|nr:single-stranded-DNA-specific exonuclease RecJ [Rhodospirillaceae bacterium]HRJ12077.1 single-stranded-DNA-specific exonuclease RecJ [Alphaproteobacteria bacterium]
MNLPERSALGRRWQLASYDERNALALAQQYQLPDVIARLLSSRGLTLENAESFLSPSLRDQMPDPFHLLDMDKAARRLADAVIKGEAITIFGDYDVDGATSTALLTRFFKTVGADARFYIPDRIEEGYGPNADAFKKFKDEGCNLVITVDCGIVAHDAIAEANAIGMEIIVVDHHVAEASLPPALAVVNPNRLDENSDCGNLAAVGVAFLVIVAVNKILREAGWFTNGRFEPDLRAWLDLVALGTICDVVALTGLNRVYVSQGLKIMGRRGNPGLAALADAANVIEPPGTYHASFILGPRLNASGRIGRGVMAAELLITDNVAEAKRIAQELCNLNEDRKELERQAYEEALGMLSARTDDDRPLVMIVGKEWHQGVIGIVASRLKEKLEKPVLICTTDDTGHLKGSGRSMPGIDLGAAVLAARQSGLLTSGGGHPMAAGMTGRAENAEVLENFLQERIRQQLAEGLPASNILPIDISLSLRGANLDLLKWLDDIGPFGAGNPEPRVMISDVLIQRAEIFGQGHVRCYLGSPAGGSMRAAAFRSANDPLGRAILSASGQPISVVGRLRINRWQGREQVEFAIEDLG